MQEYCCEDAEGYIIYDDYDDCFCLGVETEMWDSYYDEYVKEYIIINYCPFCGQKLIK